MLFLLAGATALAADAPSFASWTPENAKQIGKELAAKLNPDGSASQSLANMGNYSFLMVLRQKTGAAEVHETMADIMFVESGEATLETGGTLVNGKTTALHEIRGTAIEGGTQRPIKPGDVLTIPPGTPHWVKVAPGKEVLYLTVKVVH